MRLTTLTRPLVVLDTETTGTNPDTDRIVELAFIQIGPDGSRKSWVQRFNPGVAIPPGATAVHGISDADVAAEPRFNTGLAHNLSKGFSGCDFAGYHVNFDLRILAAEMARAGVLWTYQDAHILDARALWLMLEPRTLTDAVRHFCKTTHDDAHGALADIEATIAVLEAQSGRLAPESTVESLSRATFPDHYTKLDSRGLFRRKGDDVVIGFGKHKDRLVKDVPRSYFAWVLQSDFPSDTKARVRQALEGR